MKFSKEDMLDDHKMHISFQLAFELSFTTTMDYWNGAKWIARGLIFIKKKSSKIKLIIPEKIKFIIKMDRKKNHGWQTHKM